MRLEGPEVGSPGVPGAGSSRPPRCRTSSAYLSTDSTNTLSALMWIQAIKASLKFTLSQRSRGPCGDRRAVTPPGCSTQRHSKKGRRVGRARPELRRNARGRQKQRAGRPGRRAAFPTAPGAGEAQRAATWHMRGAPSGWAAGDWAAPDLRAFSVRLAGFRLTLCCREAHLLGGLWPGLPLPGGSSHEHSPSGPRQLSLMQMWSPAGSQSLGAKALSSHLRPPTARTGQGWVQPPSPSQGLPCHQLQPPPGRAEAPWPPSTIHCWGAGSPKEGPSD